MRLRKVQGSASVEDFELSEGISKTTLAWSEVQRQGIVNASALPDQSDIDFYYRHFSHKRFTKANTLLIIDAFPKGLD